MLVNFKSLVVCVAIFFFPTLVSITSYHFKIKFIFMYNVSMNNSSKKPYNKYSPRSNCEKICLITLINLKGHVMPDI